MTLEFFVTYLLPWLIVISALYSAIDLIRLRRKGQKKWYQIPMLVVDVFCILLYGTISITALIASFK